jgi:branched-subunit amino acid ABC-type transport system permease component
MVRPAVSGEELLLFHRAAAVAAGLTVWVAIDRGISREALEAISEDEDAAAAVGIDVMREKMRVTVISAALTAVGGAIYGQYFMYLNPIPSPASLCRCRSCSRQSPAASMRCSDRASARC